MVDGAIAGHDHTKGGNAVAVGHSSRIPRRWRGGTWNSRRGCHGSAPSADEHDGMLQPSVCCRQSRLVSACWWFSAPGLFFPPLPARTHTAREIEAGGVWPGSWFRVGSFVDCCSAFVRAKLPRAHAKSAKSQTFSCWLLEAKRSEGKVR